MQRFKIFTLCLGLSVAISSCQTETIDLPLEESGQKDYFTIEDYLKSGGDPGPFVVKDVEVQNDNQKSHISIGDIDIYTNREEFLSNSRDLFYEDFTGPNAGFYSPLNEFTDNEAFSPGDIPEGISFGTLNFTLNTNDFARLGNQLILRIYSNNPENILSLSMDFSLKVQKVAFDVLTMWGGSTDAITIVIEGSSGVIHTHVVYPGRAKFVGFETSEPITRIYFFNPLGNTVIGIDNVYFGEFPDTDSDGCIDQKDAIPSSNMETTVQVGVCNSGVENRVTSVCGVMMADKIDELEENTYEQAAFLRRDIAILTDTWVGEGLISIEEQTAILDCVPVVPANRPAPPERPVRGRP